jgi:hypothetical protein
VAPSLSLSSPLLLRMTKSSITGGLLARGVIIKLRLYRLEDFVGEDEETEGSRV